MADEPTRKDDDVSFAAHDEDALLGGEEDDDVPRPETGLHALAQLGTAVLVVGGLILAFLAVALAAGWIFR